MGDFLRFLPVVLALLWPAGAAGAAPDCADDCVAVGEWRVSVGLGLGLRTSPIEDGEATPLIVMPEVSYYGERFFLENFEFGFTAFENRHHQVNLLVTPGYDQMYFNRWDPLNFTAGGGIAGGGTLAGPSTSYSVTVSRQPGGSPTLDNDMGTYTPPESLPGPEPESVTVVGSGTLIINGQEVELSEDSYVTGVDNNTITVEHRDGEIFILGVSDGDRVSLVSEDNFASGNVNIAAVEGGALQVQEESLAQASDWRVSLDDVDKRHTAGLAGLEYSYALPGVMFYLQALTDFTGVHNGQELRTAVIFPWASGNHGLALTLGANWQSAEVVDYYHGVSERESGVAGLQYRIRRGAVTPIVRLDWQQSLSEHWSLRAFGQYLALPDEITNSPLVAQDQVTGVFIGGVYHF